ncbi:uncharacterized protein [Eucyclogobius newberryi]|uniref:uncharacterized protein n=1 Tax=Eucyclogobius newberryi TaxID=166745 RepID=UPI003B591153
MENDVNYVSVVFKNRATPTQTEKDEQSVYSEVKIKSKSVVDAPDATAGAGTKPAAPGPNPYIVLVVIISLCTLLGSVVGIAYLSILTANQHSEIQNLSSDSERLKGEKAALHDRILDLNGIVHLFEKYYCQDKPCPPCLDGWTRFENHCYYFFENPTGWKTWQQSMEFCKKRERGSRLVIVDSPEEQEFLHNNIKYYHDEFHGYWIGLSKANETWTWGNGREDTLGFWMEPLLGTSGPKAMVIANRNVTKSWDSGEEKFLNKFICENKALVID